MGLRLGILGALVSGIDINVIPGGELGLLYGKDPLIFDLNYQLFYGTHQDSHFLSSSMGIGGRYHFLNKRNISPYLGGGLTFGFAQNKKEIDYWDEDSNLNFRAHGIIGIEFHHLHQRHLNLELRADNPFYELSDLSDHRSVSFGIFSLGQF